MKVDIQQLKANDENPRYIKDDRFEKLCNSIRDFPQMLELRPIVVDENYTILGGNMRFRALQHLGHKEVEITVAAGLTDEQKKEFIIKDNVGFGEWDWDVLANSWDTDSLTEWGLSVPVFDNPLDQDERSTESAEYESRFEIVVECVSEREQEKLFNEFKNQGYKCRVLTL